jgi:hypothetical protein
MICSLISVQSIAQPAAELLAKSIEHTEAFYHNFIHEQSGLNNGSKYEGNRVDIKENKHPFYKTNVATLGALVYNGVSYPRVLMLYDEVLGVLVIEKSSRKIQLVNEKISSFKIGEDSFVKIQEKSHGNFYQVLCQGGLEVLKQESKSIIEDISSPTEGIKRYIKEDVRFYFKKGETIQIVKRKKDMLSFFPEHKKEIQSYINQQNISFKKDKARYLIKVCAFHDQLYNSK